MELSSSELNSNLNKKVPVTLTYNSTNVPNTESHDCTYFPILGLTFFRAYIPSRNSRIYRQGEVYELYAIAEGAGAPSENASLSVHGGVNNCINGRVLAGTKQITIVPRLQDVAADNLLILSGFWFAI